MSQLKILILEDNENDCLLMIRALKQAGLVPHWSMAKNKQEFETLINENFDIVLADYSLPQFNALQALNLMKDKGRTIPFIVVTGTVCAKKALECIEHGAADYLFKDRLERLGVAVARALQQDQINQDRHRLQVAQAQFIQNVSHEFRTPLGLIIGHADLLSSIDTDFSLGPLNKFQQKSLNVIIRRSEQLNKLVNDILILMELDQARLDGGYRNLSNTAVIDLGEVLSDMMPDFEPAARTRGIALISYINTKIFVRSSLKLVNAMLDNLVSNAIKFTKSGSVIVTLSAENDSSILVVQDTGIGIGKDGLERIFDRFCQVNGTASRTYGGTGLGLSVVKEVVLSLGGRIDVKSEPGTGSVFTITLPMEEQ